MFRLKRKARYRLPFKRRLERKTDYDKRLKLLRSRKPRLVIRISERHSNAQIVRYNLKGDEVLASATTQELKKLGWDYPCSNVPAAYLVGLLIGKRAKENKIKSVVVDIGLKRSTKGSRLYSLLKGALDMGLDIPHSQEILPNEERIKGEHIIRFWKKIKNENLKIKNQFSKSDPTKIEKMFETTKSNIMK